MEKLRLLIQLTRLLGLPWVLFRLRYALRFKFGFLERRCPLGTWSGKAVPPSGRFFIDEGSLERVGALLGADPLRSEALKQADAICEGRFQFFQAFERDLGIPPDWHRNPVSGERVPGDVHWTRLGDFDFGDIKQVWELSRFPWVYPLVRAYSLSGEERYAATFWNLFEDWMVHNPLNHGPNWKCGQETAIRVMACCVARWAFAASSESTPRRQAALDELMVVSAARIVANLDYAVSQKNNHGTTESAVLWSVAVLYPDHADAARWEHLGRKTMANLAALLIAEDGAFSQHSFNYHRVMLDAFTWAAAVARANGHELPFPVGPKLNLALNYLEQVLQPETGAVPVFGANDGASILPLHGMGYEDFRPSFVAACAAFGRPIRPVEPSLREVCTWLGLEPDLRAEEDVRPEPESTSDHVCYQVGGLRLFMRARAHWAFRPSHADQLHVDLFLDGRPLLVDAGSYSYNDPDWQFQFPGTAFHNTVCFDGRDQMPRISRFLFGGWRGVEPVENGMTFRDAKGAVHTRKVRKLTDGFEVIDHVSGSFEKAVVRWRLSPEQPWTIKEGIARAPGLIIEIEAGGGMREENGWISRIYGQREPLRVLAVDMDLEMTTVRTRFRIAPPSQ